MDPIELKKLELERRAEFFKDLAALQGEIHALKRDTKGYGYNYADLNQTLSVLREVCPKYGFCYPSVGEVRNGQQIIKTIIGHKSGFSIQSEILINADKESRGVDKNEVPLTPEANDPQAIGSWWTYGTRYTKQGAFGMSAQDDDGSKVTNRRGNKDDGGAGYANVKKGSGQINEKQVSRLYAIATGSGWNPAQVMLFVQNNFNKEPAQIAWGDEYDRICKYFEDNVNPNPR